MAGPGTRNGSTTGRRVMPRQRSAPAGRGSIYRLHAPDSPPHEWEVVLIGRSVDGLVTEGQLLTFGGEAREPDVACVGTRRLASAWFQKSGDTWRVKVHARPVFLDPEGDTVPEQSFDLGTGELGRGLAIAATKDMVYVAWFQGTALKLRRFSVGAGPAYLLSSLGTSTLGTLARAGDVELGAQGSTRGPRLPAELRRAGAAQHE